MPDVPSRERFGIQFGGPVLRDSWQLLRDRNADGAFVFTPFLSPAAGAGFDLIRPKGNQIQLANIATGMMDMESADGIEFLIGGAAAAGTGTWRALAYNPVYGTTDTGKQTITAFAETLLAAGGLTLNGPAIGAAGAAAFPGSNGIVAGDVLSDSTTVTTTPAANVANVELVTPAVTTTAALVRIVARGNRFIRVTTTLGTAAALWVAARRLQGQALRAR